MKILGIIATVITALSFILWLASYILFRFFVPAAGYNSPLAYVAQTMSVLGILTEYLTMLILSISIIMLASKKANS